MKGKGVVRSQVDEMSVWICRVCLQYNCMSVKKNKKKGKKAFSITMHSIDFYSSLWGNQLHHF